MLKELNDADED